MPEPLGGLQRGGFVARAPGLARRTRPGLGSGAMPAWRNPADATDLKSVPPRRVGVRIPQRAPMTSIAYALDGASLLSRAYAQGAALFSTVTSRSMLAALLAIKR